MPVLFVDIFNSAGATHDEDVTGVKVEVVSVATDGNGKPGCAGAGIDHRQSAWPTIGDGYS
jgi:hypothetical protein